MGGEDKKPSPWDDFKPIGEVRGDFRPPSRWSEIWGKIMTLIAFLIVGLLGAGFVFLRLARDLGYTDNRKSIWMAFVLIISCGIAWAVIAWIQANREYERTRRPPKG